MIWPTTRKDWLGTFFRLQDHFQFTFIPSTFPQEPNFATKFDCRYWSEFTSAQDVLDEIRPDGIIFMSIESGLSITINYLAQKRGIKTIILQHGIFTNYKDYRTREKLWRKSSRARKTKAVQSSRGFSTWAFLKGSLKGIDRFKLTLIGLYTKLQQKIGPYWVSKNLPLKMKRANQYLCYSPFNATIHRETDRISESIIGYVGSPELIQYLNKESDSVQDSYYLHIDQALAENSFGEETLSKQTMVDFYLELNGFCISQGVALYIKLHPESYNSSWLPDHDNIYYLRHIDNFNKVIQSALGCFGFYSTMVIPAIYWKPTILFNVQYSGLQEEIKKMRAAQVLDFWDFDVRDFDFQTLTKPELIKSYFIQPKGVIEDSLVWFLSE